MAFVVEDGTGKSDATSYVCVADADAYWTDRGTPTEWAAASSTDKQQALVKATSFIEAGYLWSTGSIGSTTQALGWPRLNSYDRHGLLFDTDEIPQVLKDAVTELAQKVLEGETLSADVTDRVDKETIGPISVDYATASTGRKQWVFVEELLTGLVYGTAVAEIRRS